jgi:hypothetical protein
MNMHFIIKNLKSEVVAIDELNIEVDYTVEEFTAIIKLYGESIPIILTALKEMQ